MAVQRGWSSLQAPRLINIPHRILNAMHRPAVEFKGPDVKGFCKALSIDFKNIYKTKINHPFIYAANGHGVWKSAITNILAPGAKVLIPETGRFALSWLYMAEM
ncbi:MAG: hypothetical protein CBB68_02685 [Rhodospirillaceae bacterium TMED8]|nr:hypothetical protein [Magnetovibrio sp.]OUT52281.1 MAG: hypothetical protein CBB68_02685 [Rhodospirillaceae bacterium TMED8]|tara:strand:+ start:276 stop:587 length:312 start_codon:yes stop_codon:yes gene_type:complete